MTKTETAAVDVPEQSGSKAKSTFVVETKHGKGSRGLAILDLILRVAGMVSALAAAAAMGTSEQQLPFTTQFFQFSAEYDDLPTYVFFLVAMSIIAAYLILSIPFSVVAIVRPHAAGPRLLLLIVDSVALVFTTAASAATTAIVVLAHNGNEKTNWVAICNQFNDFCQQTSGAVVASLGAVLMFVLLIILSGFALRRH